MTTTPLVFWSKKIVSAFLLPIPFGLFWLTLGIILLLCHRAKRFRLLSILVGFLTIFIFSLNPVASALINPLQKKYAPLIHPPASIDKIIVLGGGVSGGKNYPPNLTLHSASLSRLVEGIRLLKEVQKTNPSATLILSGGRVFRSPSVAGKMRNTAVMLCVDQSHTKLENGSLDTRDEAIYLQQFVGKKPFILVTSAYHMPRAMDLFERLGMHPVHAPTQLSGIIHNPWLYWIPNSQNLNTADIAIHEYLGILWGMLRGYIAV